MEGLCECGCGKATTVYKGKPRRFIHGHAMRVSHGAVKAGLARWRSTPEGRESIRLNGEKKAERLRGAEHRARVSKANTGRGWAQNTAVMTPTLKDIFWAAGFLEGEGSFFAQDGRFPQVSATQVQREPLQRLAALFGGKIWDRKSRGANQQPTCWWRVCGARARGIGMTLYPIMSPRRKGQIRQMLGGANG